MTTLRVKPYAAKGSTSKVHAALRENDTPKCPGVAKFGYLGAQDKTLYVQRRKS